MRCACLTGCSWRRRSRGRMEASGGTTAAAYAPPSLAHARSLSITNAMSSQATTQDCALPWTKGDALANQPTD